MQLAITELIIIRMQLLCAFACMCGVGDRWGVCHG